MSFFLDLRDLKGRRRSALRCKKQSGGLFFSPWESPFLSRRSPLGLWTERKLSRRRVTRRNKCYLSYAKKQLKGGFFICHRVTSLILKRAISHILPQLPFYLLFSPLPVLLFLLISSFSLSISLRIGQHSQKS